MKKSLDTIRGELLPAHREQYSSAPIFRSQETDGGGQAIKINESV